MGLPTVGYANDDVSTRDSFKPALLTSDVGGILIQNPKPALLTLALPKALRSRNQP